MRTLLAPMEGVVDNEMRDVLTRIGGYERCVTEFIRVNDQVLPDHVFFRLCPELKHGGKTPSGVPVFVQLLGGNAKSMGQNAAKAQTLEPMGIDINFGCPSKTVTKSDGGSALLREPDRIGNIVSEVRDNVDSSIPVTAKIRLGFSNHDLLEEVVEQIVNGGASELCIHARTREDRYKPPAYWSAVKKVRQKTPIPIIINGEIWSIEDAKQAKAESGCDDIMLGRGALTCPDLAKSIHADFHDLSYQPLSWLESLEVVHEYLRNSQSKHPLFVSNRSKQWLVFLQMHFKPAKELFTTIKRLKDADDVFNAFNQHKKAFANL